MHPDDKLTEHLYASFGAMFGTNGQLPLNLRHYPKSDEQIQKDQDAWDRRHDDEKWSAYDRDTGILKSGEI